jgi:hypothetical protein
MAALVISIFCFGASSVTSMASTSNQFDYSISLSYYYTSRGGYIYYDYNFSGNGYLCAYKVSDGDYNHYVILYNGILSTCTYTYNFTYNGSIGTSNYSYAYSYDKIDFSADGLPGLPGIYDDMSHSGSGYTDTVFDIGTMPVFDDLSLVKNYLETGDTTGNLNKPDYDDPDLFDENFYFEGFKGDNFVNASWTGVSDRTNLLDEDVEYYVRASIGYAENGSTEITVKDPIDEDFEYEPMKLNIDVSEYKDTYDDMYVRAVYFTPCYRISGAFYYGTPSIVYLNEDGSYQYTFTSL